MKERYSKVPRSAFADDRLTRAELKVLGALGAFLDKKNEGWPSQQRIADDAGVSIKTVTRAIKKLRECDYLTTEPRIIAGMKGTLRYSVKFKAGAVIPFPKNAVMTDGTKLSQPEGQKDEKPSNDGSDKNVPTEKPDRTPECPHVGTSNVRTVTAQENSPSSVPNGTGADAPEDDEDLITSAELKKHVVWAVGKTLLKSQGTSKDAAASFIGMLIKENTLDPVFLAILEAVKKPPVKAQGWLKRTAEAEARRTGKREADPVQPPSEAEWDQILDRWLASGAWPGGIGEPPTSPDYGGPEDALEARITTISPDHPIRTDCERARAARQRRTA